MAEQLGISREQLWRYENGKTPIGEEAASRLAAGLLKHFEGQQEEISATCQELRAFV